LLSIPPREQPGRRASRAESRPRQHPFPQHACDGREQQQHPRPDEHGHLRSERVVVAEADLVGRRRVVLVDHRHGAEREECVERAARVDVRAALADLGAREQDLRSVQAVRVECVLPRALERRLPERRRGLQARERRRPPLEPEPAQAERDRAGGDDADRRAAFDDLRDLSRTRTQQCTARASALVDDEARAELDDERPLHRCWVPSPTTRYWRRYSRGRSPSRAAPGRGRR
jgi:hypothetical protein